MDGLFTSHHGAQESTKSRYQVAPKAAPDKETVRVIVRMSSPDDHYDRSVNS